MKRRTFLGTIVACIAYCLTASGIIKPQLRVVRHLRYGDKQKLLCEAKAPPMKLIAKYTGTVNSDPSPVGLALCTGIDGDRKENGEWSVVSIYRDGDGSVVVSDESGKRQTFQRYRKLWHGLLYGRFPAVENVTSDEFYAA